MSQDFLSQDEVDALLKGVTGEVDENPESDADNAGVRTYNIATQERIVRGRMPTLELINERFARLFRIGLFNFLRRSAEISVGPVRVVKYSEFIRNMPVPTNLNLIKVNPLRGTSLFVFDPNLVFLVVDNLFGGDGRFHTRVEGRDFTPTEQRIIQRLLEVAFSEYEKSWSPIFKIHLEYLRAEMNTQFANIATPNEVVVATTFTIDLGNNSGEFHICMPYSMIEPIRDSLASSMQGDQMEADTRWVKLLSREIQQAEVELVANLSEVPVTLGQILNMKKGDIISLDIPEAIIAQIDGVPIMECKYGVLNGQYALKISKILGNSESDAGGKHG
ncbi:MAG: flagellar motor switch protein FliM [Burkholderiales bacterium]|nr:flagellar motor switch protein FliM [Burkholderiales bacterium]